MGPEGTGRPAGISAQNVPLVTVTGHRDRDRDRDGIFILLIVARPFAHTLSSLLIIPLHPRPLMGQATRHTGMVPDKP